MCLICWSYVNKQLKLLTNFHFCGSSIANKCLVFPLYLSVQLCSKPISSSTSQVSFCCMPLFAKFLSCSTKKWKIDYLKASSLTLWKSHVPIFLDIWIQPISTFWLTNYLNSWPYFACMSIHWWLIPICMENSNIMVGKVWPTLLA